MFVKRYIFGKPKKTKESVYKPILKKSLPPILENESKEDESDESKEDESKEDESKEDGDEEGKNIVDALISRHKNSIDNSRHSDFFRESILSRRSSLSDFSLQSSNNSDDDYIIPDPESDNIDELLKELNKLALEQQHNDLHNDLHTKSLNNSLLLLDKMEKIEKRIDNYLSGLIDPTIPLDIKSTYVDNLITNIRLRNKTPEYEKKYKIYKQNLNELLTELVMILKHVKSNLTAIYIKQYKLELIENINDSIKKIKYILSELFAYYNENLPFYKKKWWGGKTRKHKKWSNKYKKSINCKKPKGFSQKQYCKYGRTKKRKLSITN